MTFEIVLPQQRDMKIRNEVNEKTRMKLFGHQCFNSKGVNQGLHKNFVAVNHISFTVSVSRLGLANGGFGGFGGSPVTATSELTITPVLTPALLIGAFAFGVIISVIFALDPAWRASRLKPVQAMRYE